MNHILRWAIYWYQCNRDTSLGDIALAFEVHDPAPLEITELLFGTRPQQSNVLISADFIVALNQLSIHCNYSDFLCRDTCFVCGLKFNNKKMQTKLLNTDDLTLEKACQMTKAMEMTEKNGQECRPATSNATGERQGKQGWNSED